jgi:two-component system sensor histidine kinase BaeS
VVSGSLEGDVYAATSLPGVPASALATSGAPRFARAGPNAVVVVAAVRRIRGAGLGGGYLLLVSAAVLLVAAGVAALLSRRVTRPLAAAVAATERLAAGDLSVRLPPDQRYPELGSLGSSINALAAALAESQDRERQFLLAVSHDLRTPLTAIEGYAEAIADGVAPDPAQAAAVIDAEARRLARLVEDLLDLARLGAKRFSLRPERLGLGPLAAAAAEALRPTIEGLGLTLRLALPDQDPLASVLDPDRARQVLANLLENAASYARRSVALAAWREPGPPPGVVAVAVLDDGPGIAPAELPRVFEPLYRGQAPGRRVGTGLGLAICAELVGAMGGRIEARSPVPPELARLLEAPGGPGTAMVVRFPGAP